MVEMGKKAYIPSEELIDYQIRNLGHFDQTVRDHFINGKAVKLIGYGHVISLEKNQIFLKSTISQNEAREKLKQDLQKAREETKKMFDEIMGSGLFLQLDMKRQEFLTQLTLNLGIGSVK